MLTFKTEGPDQHGRYSILYATPGNAQLTLHSIGYSQKDAEKECSWLNEEQEHKFQPVKES